MAFLASQISPYDPLPTQWSKAWSETVGAVDLTLARSTATGADNGRIGDSRSTAVFSTSLLSIRVGLWRARNDQPSAHGICTPTTTTQGNQVKLNETIQTASATIATALNMASTPATTGRSQQNPSPKTRPEASTMKNSLHPG